MNRKIWILVCILLTLTGLYFIMPLQNRNVVLGSSVALAGFYYARWVRVAVFIFSITACFISLPLVKEYPFSTLSVCVVFISLIPLPYYFHTKLKKCKREFFIKNRALKIERNSVFLKYKKSFSERQRYEKITERVKQFYIVNKKLSECILRKEHVKTISKFIDDKAEVIGSCIFERTKSEWKLLSCSGILQNNENLVSYIDALELSESDKQCCIIDNEEFDSRNLKIIYWPLKVDEELLGCIMIIAELEDADVCVEDGLTLSPHIALCLKKAKFFDEISYKSRNDQLTGLYRKHYFLQRLDSHIQTEDSFCVLMLDIDHFKKINDEYGHLAGDRVLVVVARIIFAIVKPSDLVSRFGGEEFSVLATTTDKIELKTMAMDIKDFIKGIIFEENGKQFNITVSIGVSCSSMNIKDQNFLINAADKALYKAKNGGRDQVVFYDDIVH